MAFQNTLIYLVLLTFNMEVILCEMKCSGLLKKNSSTKYSTSKAIWNCVSNISCVFNNSSMHIKWTLPINQDNAVGFNVSYRNENGYGFSGKIAVGKTETNIIVNVSITPNASYLIDIQRIYDREGDDFKGFNTSKVCRAPQIIQRDTTTTKEQTTTHRNTTMKEEPITTHRDTTTKEEQITTKRDTTCTTKENITESILHRIGNSKTGSLLPVISGIGGAISLVSSTVIILCLKLRKKKRITNKNKPEKTQGQTSNDEDGVYNHISRPSTARMSLQTNRYDDTYDHMDVRICDHMDDYTYDHMDANDVNAINKPLSNKACDQRRATPGSDIYKDSDPEYDLAVLHVQDDKNEVNSLLNPYACAGKSVMKRGDSSDVNISRQSGPNGDLYTVVAITDH